MGLSARNANMTIEQQFKEAALLAGIALEGEPNATVSEQVNEVTFTLFTNSNGALSKQYSLDSNGGILKQPAAQMYSGKARKVTLPFREFTQFQKHTKSNQAVGFGVNEADTVKISVNGALKPGYVARTKESFPYTQGPGVIMLDHDFNEFSKSFTAETLRDVLIEVHPEIATAECISRSSISAGVYRIGETPSTSKGHHTYMPVLDASDLPRYGQVLFNRLWLAGYGFIALASNGAMLIRSIIDGVVFSPERLDFVGKPVVGEGLTYTPPTVDYRPGGYLDTHTLPDLTEEEHQQVRAKKEAAKRAMAGKAKLQQGEWKAEHVERLVGRGVSRPDAIAQTNKLASDEFKVLSGDFPLEFTSLGTVTVAEVLLNPKDYDGKSLADPIEGVDYGRTTAKFYWNEGVTPCINSFAHGKSEYVLVADVVHVNTGEEREEAVNAGAPEKTRAIDALLENVTQINLKAVCKSLGWRSDDEVDYPKQKHIIVAIVISLIETAKKHNWRLMSDCGLFYIYNGAYWLMLQNEEVKEMLEDASIKMGLAKIDCFDVPFTDKLFKQAIRRGFFKERNFKKQSIINLVNGSLVLNEKGVKLKPFNYRDFLTHQLDFAYDADAVNPRFLKYLEEVLPDPDTRKTLQQVAGYLFIKGLKAEKVFFLYGAGSNGKSVFFEVLSGILGPHNFSTYSLKSLTDDTGYFRAKIKDKVVNYGSDIQFNTIDASMFKKLASGEEIEARLPYHEPFTMTDYAKLIFNINRLESANIEHTHGFERRVLIIPFLQTIAEKDQDKDLHHKILSNRAGVLNWVIEGSEEVIKNRGVFVSDECENFKSTFIKEADSAAMFEAEHIIANLDKNAVWSNPTWQKYMPESEKTCSSSMDGTGYSEIVHKIYQEYKVYCIEAGFKKPLGRNNFTKRMEAIGFEKKDKTEGWFLEKHYKKV
jgi:putative DNA primase/helicase